MNKKLLTVMILSTSLLSGCSSKNKENTTENTSTNTNITTSTNSNNKETNSTTNSESNSSKSSEDKDTKESEEQKVLTRESLKKLISQSDYISRVKVTVSADKTIASTILQDFKGDLSHIDIELPKNLSPNTEYLVFLQDGDNGKITNTSTEDSYLVISDENDRNLQYIQSQFETKETKNSSTKEKNSKNSNSKTELTSNKSENSNKKETNSSKNENSNKK